MQDRYVGDVGDFYKLALLRHLSDCLKQRVGVAWCYVKPGDRANNDGRHIDYLRKERDGSSEFKIDDRLFEALHELVLIKDEKLPPAAWETNGGNRLVAKLEDKRFLPNAEFHDACLDEDRKNWAERVNARLSGCGLLFLDPDNGLHKQPKSNKSLAIKEIRSVHQGRLATIVYHHQGKGRKHLVEAQEWIRELNKEGIECAGAIRAARYSPRLFFILSKEKAVREAAKAFVSRNEAFRRKSLRWIDESTESLWEDE